MPLPASEDSDAALPEITAAAPVAPADESLIAAPLAGLAIERMDDGSLRICAPPQLAGPRAELFDRLARGLRASAG